MKLHSKRVEKICKYTRNECILANLFRSLTEAQNEGNIEKFMNSLQEYDSISPFGKTTLETSGEDATTLETSGEDVKLHSKRVEKM